MERQPMTNEPKNLQELDQQVRQAFDNLNLAETAKEVDQLQAEMAQPDFWTDREMAAGVSQREAQLRTKLERWQNLKKTIDELMELSASQDASLMPEIDQQTQMLIKRYNQMRQELLFKGIYDERAVIMSIYAGAGGTDAQDWAQMLLRMYTRWAESEQASVELLDQSAGEEAGIKSATLKISGSDYLYGKLKHEHGVHRLVRKSPFNSAGSRETSFARVDVLPVIDEPQEIELDDKELKIDVFRSAGAGGQSVNTTDSAVRITHLPTGISVSIQNERSQLRNKETALGILRSRLAQLQQEQHAKAIADIKGPTQANEWGSQIRNYILDDRIVRDLRSGYESHDPQKILDGNINPLIAAELEAFA